MRKRIIELIIGLGATSCAKTGGAVCSQALKVHYNGTDYWIPLFSSNS